MAVLPAGLPHLTLPAAQPSQQQTRCLLSYASNHKQQRLTAQHLETNGLVLTSSLADPSHSAHTQHVSSMTHDT
jgi:hypothetical protein